MSQFDEDTFRQPPNQYRPFPFWFLNDDLDEDHIRFALDEFAKENKYGGVVAHPRTGLEVPYLSEAFFQKIEFIVEECKKRDLFVYLYDEYNWPSGVVGGQLLREHPEFRQSYLAFEIFPARKKLEKTLPLEGDIIIKAFGILGGKVKVLDEFIRGGTQFSYSGGFYEIILLFYRKIYRGALFATHCAPGMQGELGYIDLMNEAAIEYFIQTTHERYKARVGHEFGKTIKAMFIDEPSNYEGFQYTETLFSEFKARKNYDLADRLFQLVLPLGDYHHVRYDYHEVATDLYVQAYRKLAHWCAQNKIALTGHLNQEESINQIPTNHGDVYGPLSQMQVPGIDYLTDWNGLDEGLAVSEAANFPGKMISSIAHAHNRDYNIVEIFGGCGWDTTPARLKNTVLWIEALGTAGINVHAAHLSLKGLRKRDFPASHFVQEPWWATYHHFSDLVGRLAYFNTTGTHACPLLLLFPKSTFWVEHVPTRISERFEAFERSFIATGDALLKSHHDFDYLFEDQILSGDLTFGNGSPGACHLGTESYSGIIVPPCSTLPSKILDRLQDFVAQGGILVFVGEIPLHSEARRDDPKNESILRELLGPEIFERRTDEEVTFLNEVYFHQFDDNKKGETVFIPTKVPAKERKLRKNFRFVLDSFSQLADISITGKRNDLVLYNHRVTPREHLYLVVNTSLDSTNLEISFPVVGDLTILDPETGSEYHPQGYEAYASEVDIAVTLEFPGNRGLIFWITKKDAAASLVSPDIPGKMTRTITLKNWTIIPPEKGNNFVLDGLWKVNYLREGPDAFHFPSDNLPVEISPKSFPFGTRLKLNLLKGLILLAKPFLPKGKKQKMARYKDLNSLISLGYKFLKILGLNPKNFGTYSKLDLANALQQKLGINFLSRPFLPGWEYEVEYSLKVDYIPPALELIYEDLDVPIEIIVNNEWLEVPGTPGFVWDRANRIIANFQENLRPGKNSIKIRSVVPNFPDLTPSIHGIEPMVLRGMFQVQKGKIVPLSPSIITSGDDWCKNGFPYYSGALQYETSFNVPRGVQYNQLTVEFPEIKETIQLIVNGRDVGIRAWSPYSFDITPFVQPGENSMIAMIQNTAANFFSKPTSSGMIKSPVLNFLVD